MKWTDTILKLLPATLREINSNPTIIRMNRKHRRQRVARGSWEKPVNSMAYNTLYRLRKQGRVIRNEDGVYVQKKK